MASGGKRPGAGRKKGAGNKNLEPLRQRVDLLLDSQWSKLVSNLNEMADKNPKSHVEICLELLEFSLPKLARIEQRNVTTVEHLLSMTIEERAMRIRELKKQLQDDNTGN